MRKHTSIAVLLMFLVAGGRGSGQDHSRCAGGRSDRRPGEGEAVFRGLVEIAGHGATRPDVALARAFLDSNR
jgi:hypothetical protein